MTICYPTICYPNDDRYPAKNGPNYSNRSCKYQRKRRFRQRGPGALGSGTVMILYQHG